MSMSSYHTPDFEYLSAISSHTSDESSSPEWYPFTPSPSPSTSPAASSSSSASPAPVPLAATPAAATPRRHVSSTRAAPPKPKGTSRKSADHIPRPPNAFILFRRHLCNELLSKKVEHDHRHVSRIAGLTWRTLPPAEKAYWQALAAQLKAEHAARHPDYRFRPSAKQVKQRRKGNRNTLEDHQRNAEIAALVARGLSGEALESEVRRRDRAAERDHAQPSAGYANVVFHLESPGETAETAAAAGPLSNPLPLPAVFPAADTDIGTPACATPPPRAYEAHDPASPYSLAAVQAPYIGSTSLPTSPDAFDAGYDAASMAWGVPAAYQPEAVDAGYDAASMAWGVPTAYQPEAFFPKGHAGFAAPAQYTCWSPTQEAGHIVEPQLAAAVAELGLGMDDGAFGLGLGAGIDACWLPANGLGLMVSAEQFPMWEDFAQMDADGMLQFPSC